MSTKESIMLAVANNHFFRKWSKYFTQIRAHNCAVSYFHCATLEIERSFWQYAGAIVFGSGASLPRFYVGLVFLLDINL